ncbi:PadR family transcriptional regulator, partial [Streptomyces puniciscabiei]
HVVLRGGIAYERMTIAWLDDVLATLHRIGADHPRL